MGNSPQFPTSHQAPSQFHKKYHQSVGLVLLCSKMSLSNPLRATHAPGIGDGSGFKAFLNELFCSIPMSTHLTPQSLLYPVTPLKGFLMLRYLGENIIIRLCVLSKWFPKNLSSPALLQVQF